MQRREHQGNMKRSVIKRSDSSIHSAVMITVCITQKAREMLENCFNGYSILLFGQYSTDNIP